MKYLKHYWIAVHGGYYCCHENPVEKRHPEAEFPGLDVKLWLHDAEGIDVCLSVVPDTTDVFDITDGDDVNKKCVQVLTESQFNSVNTPLQESQDLAQQSILSDGSIDTSLQEQSQLKYEEAIAALYAL